MFDFCDREVLPATSGCTVELGAYELSPGAASWTRLPYPSAFDRPGRTSGPQPVPAGDRILFSFRSEDAASYMEFSDGRWEAVGTPPQGLESDCATSSTIYAYSSVVQAPSGRDGLTGQGATPTENAFYRVEPSGAEQLPNPFSNRFTGTQTSVACSSSEFGATALEATDWGRGAVFRRWNGEQWILDEALNVKRDRWNARPISHPEGLVVQWTPIRTPPGTDGILLMGSSEGGPVTSRRFAADKPFQLVPVANESEVLLLRDVEPVPNEGEPSQGGDDTAVQVTEFRFE